MNRINELDLKALDNLETLLQKDKALVARFKKNPQSVAEDNGVILPEGFEIDFNQEYFNKKNSMTFPANQIEMQEENVPKLEIYYGHLVVKE